MNTGTLRPAAALLGAVILSVTLGGQPALANEHNRCPCLTGDLVDELFQTLQQSVDQPGQKVFCVDDPGFTTFDFFDRSPPRHAVYIDVTFPTGRMQARCTVDLFHVSKKIPLAESRVEITNAQARDCRKEIVKSEVWLGSGCPNN